MEEQIQKVWTMEGHEDRSTNLLYLLVYRQNQGESMYSLGGGVPRLGLLTFSFFLKRSFRYENDDENRKTKTFF